MKETLTHDQIIALIKMKLLKPLFIAIISFGSFLMALTVSFYIHKFFALEKSIEWRFTDIASICFAGVFTLKTLPWATEKKGKSLMSLFLTIACYFFWKYDLATMVGLPH